MSRELKDKPRRPKEYAVPVSFTFKGTFFVKADSKEDAIRDVKDSCGLVLGGNVHSTLPDENVDWHFPVHPEKEIGNPR